MYKQFATLIVIFSWCSIVRCQELCDLTPLNSPVPTPSEDKNGVFKFSIDIKEDKPRYVPDQTYVLILESTDVRMRKFRSYMITVEDPNGGKSDGGFKGRKADVGSLKVLNVLESRYSERCHNTVENTDNTEKSRVEVHWVSPKSEKTKSVRLRAMLGENDEVWYMGENLTIIVERNQRPKDDMPPNEEIEICSLCSEARYEVIFTGRWSRLTHPRHYPSKPDENGYSHMIGASHGNDYTMWHQGDKAGEGLKLMAEDANITLIERNIIDQMQEKGGTRTLIRGIRRHHPEMSLPSHSLFRAERYHHLFSLAVAMRPSPDWFLGTSRFELCSENGWLEYHKMSLYPWDAGTMNGISYEDEKVVTQPVDNVERVGVGSFDERSPFYKMNLIDLKPFATLEIRRLDVYEWNSEDCDKEDTNQESEDIKTRQSGWQRKGDDNPEEDEQPLAAESKTKCDGSSLSCEPYNGVCGPGTMTKKTKNEGGHLKYQDKYNTEEEDSCINEDVDTPYQQCFVDCFT